MKTEEFIKMRSETERVIAKALAAKVRRILFDIFGHGPADVPAYRPWADLIPGHNGELLLGHAFVVHCPAGAYLRNIHVNGEGITVSWDWTLNGETLSPEDGPVSADGADIPACVLEAALRCANVAFVMSVFRELEAAAGDKTGDALISSFSENGASVIADLSDETKHTLSGGTAIEKEYKKENGRLPDAMYVVIERKGVQAIAVTDGSEGRALLAYAWNVDTGLVDIESEIETEEEEEEEEEDGE